MTRLPRSLFRQLLHNFEAHRVEELRLSLESGFFGTWWDWARVPLNIQRVASGDISAFTSLFQLMIVETNACVTKTLFSRLRGSTWNGKAAVLGE